MCIRDSLEAGLTAAIADVVVNGAGAPRLPGTSNLAFAGLNAATLMMRLDLEGIAVSTGSACASGVFEPSHVIAALGLDERYARGVVRFTLGRATTRAEVDRVISIVPAVAEGIRAFRTAAIR